jgi:hypothetical protein
MVCTRAIDCNNASPHTMHYFLTPEHHGSPGRRRAIGLKIAVFVHQKFNDMEWRVICTFAEWATIDDDNNIVYYLCDHKTTTDRQSAKFIIIYVII